MAVKASDKLNLPHDFGDDDGPVTFKRYTLSKKKQFHSELTKLTSNSRDGQSNTVEAFDKPNLPHDFGDDDGPVTSKRYTLSKKKQLHSELKNLISNSRDGQSNTVEAFDKPNLPHDFGDDDGPITFKRYTSSKKKQLHSELTKLTSNSRDGQSNTVEASDKPNLPHDFGDDDGPVTFKRYTSSKKKQLHSELRNLTSNSRDGQSNTVEASDKANLPRDFGDDDGPVTFKRYTSSKKKQLHSELTKLTSNSRDGQSNIVEASDKANLPHDFGDDDGPVTFKRYTSSKKKQLHSELRKLTSNSHDGQSNTVEAYDKPNLPHDFGNDDGPVTFKRYTSSKERQLHSELTKLTSNSHDG